MAVRFTVLGPVRAWRDGVEVELGPPKQRALLALLLVRSGQPVSLAEIVDVLWRQDPPGSAVNVVQRHVGAVRRLVGPAGSLVRGSGGYRLDTASDAVDLLRFRHLVAQARAAGAGSPDEAAGLLAEALSLWQGETGAGLPEDVRTHPVFAAVDREYLAAVKDAGALALRAADPALLLAVLQRAAARHPLDEALQARLIRVLAVTGRQAEALEVHQAVRARLAEELGIDPGPELRAAHQDVLRQTAAPAPAAPADENPAPDLPGAPPAHPGPSVTVRPAQLPPDLPGFGGRHAELARTETLLDPVTRRDSAYDRPPTVVISAIGGMAGIGKTTLAVHWAHRVAHRFPDGQLYVNLRGFDPTGQTVPPDEALRGFLHALGVAPQHVPAGPDAQAALYRSLLAGRRVLVLLDNARDAHQVRPLLPATPGCLVIVTSRDRLHGLIAADGATPLPLGPLTTDEAREVLARRLGAGRVAAEPEAVDDVIGLCGHLPLALAVVAARAATHPTFTLSSVAAELRESHGSLDAFSAGDPATDARSVFSWSYRALGPEAARLFRLLSVHPGADISAGLTASLAGLPPRRARALLAELTGAHLLTEHTPGRYTFHDLLRAYAVELTEEDDPAEIHAARGRVLDHCLHTARTAAVRLAPHRVERVPLPPAGPGTFPETFGSEDRAAGWLTANLQVLLAAVQEATATGFGSHAWRLAVCLELFLDRRGQWQEQLLLQRAALDAAARTDDPLGRAHAHRALGFAHGRRGDHADADTHLRRALGLFTELGDRDGQARTHRSLAFQANGHTRHHEALDHYRQALDLYRASENLPGQAAVLNETGWTHILLGDHEPAITECREALALHQRTDDRNGEAAAWDSLGVAHHHLGQYEQALGCYAHALDIYRDISDRYLEADTLSHIGDTHHARGDTGSAAETWQSALTILDELDHPDTRPLQEKLDATRR